VAKFYDEHKRDEFQAFDVNIHKPKKFKTQNAFIHFLGVMRLGFKSQVLNSHFPLLLMWPMPWLKS